LARIRAVKPAFFKSVSVAELPSDACRLTWIGLWTYADDAGRGVDDARLVKGEIWALHDKQTAKTVEKHLQAIADAGMICRYETGGRRYLHVINWRRHQTINRPQPSMIPPCPVHDSFSEPAVNDHDTDTDPSRQEGKGREGKGKEEEGNGKEAAAADPVTHDPLTGAAAAAAIIDQGISILVDRRIAANGAIHKPGAYRHRVAPALRTEYADQIASILAGTSGLAVPLTAENVADHLEPAGRQPDSPTRSYELQPLGCASCEAGFIDLGEGTVTPCPTCLPKAAADLAMSR
jgi:hypothetical protein